jgi:hypothetical protein
MPTILLLLLAGVLCFLVAPVIVGIVLLARNRTKAGSIVLGIYGLLIVSFVLSGAFARRSTPGRIVRWCMGAGLAKQEVEDQVEDLRHSSSLPKIQNWAIETLRRFRSGQISTNGEASYWSLGRVQLAPSEIPEFVSAEWKEGERPEVSIGVSNSGEPEFVVVAWYLKGVVFGDDRYRSPLSEPNYQQQIVPGVYAYYLYK